MNSPGFALNRLPAATAALPTAPTPPSMPPAAQPAEEGSDLKEKFGEFVGQTFFGQLMASMRKTVGKSKYFHGGRGEEIFQSQMDQIFVEKLSEQSASQLADPMFELAQLNRRTG